MIISNIEQSLKETTRSIRRFYGESFGEWRMCGGPIYLQRFNLLTTRKIPKTYIVFLSRFVPLLTKDKSTLIKDPDKIRERWREHFAGLFFNPSVIDESVISSLPQLDILHHMDRLPSVDEVVSAMKKIKAGKAPVCIPTELLQHGGKHVANADDDSHSEWDMRDIINCFSTACDAFGLTISIKKTKEMFIPAPGAPYIELCEEEKTRCCRHICVLE